MFFPDQAAASHFRTRGAAKGFFSTLSIKTVALPACLRCVRPLKMLAMRLSGLPSAGRALLRPAAARRAALPALPLGCCRSFASAAAAEPTPAEVCEQAIASAPVVVFSRSWCPFCKQLEALFGQVIAPDLRVAHFGALVLPPGWLAGWLASGWLAGWLAGWLLAAGCWLLAAGCWLLAAGCWRWLRWPRALLLLL
eukprot:COSAG06_NODE_153_length_21876_cov_5.100628_17_plen_196_part_00